MPWDSVQEQRPRGALSGKEHSRSSANDGAGSADFLFERFQGHVEAENSERNRSRLSPFGPVGDDAVRRRSAKTQVGRAPDANGKSGHSLYSRSTHHGPALRR